MTSTLLRSQPLRLLILGIGLFTMLSYGAEALSQTTTSCPHNVGKISLRFATNLPRQHYLSVQGDQVFIKAVARLSCGKIKIEYFPSSQLGKASDMVTMANSGVADIVAASPPYVSAQMPLGNAFDLPQILPNADIGSKALYEVATNPKTVIYQNDFKKNGLHFLFGATLPLYQIVTVKTPIHSLSDIKGLQLRSGGGSEDLVVKALGAVPVNMPRGEDYEAFQRGTLDGGVFNLPSLHPNKVDEVTHYATLNANVTSFVYAVEISQTEWAHLSHTDQTILQRAAKKAEASLSSHMVSDNRKAISQLKKEGMVFTKLSSRQIKVMRRKLKPVITRWVAQMKNQGYDGRSAVEEVRAAVKKVER